MNTLTMLVPRLHWVKINRDILLLHGPPVRLVDRIRIIIHYQVQLLNPFPKELHIRTPIKCKVHMRNMLIQPQLINILYRPLQLILTSRSHSVYMPVAHIELSREVD